MIIIRISINNLLLKLKPKCQLNFTISIKINLIFRMLKMGNWIKNIRLRNLNCHLLSIKIIHLKMGKFISNR
jgi:hypothetical protein